MVYRYILFDLDGTLTESGPGIMNAAAYALQKMGCAPLDAKTLRKFVGPPLAESMRKYGNLSRTDACRAIDCFREYYEAKGMYENSVYPGIPQALDALKRAGKLLAVATSKPEDTARQILKHFQIAPYFDAICGASRDESKVAKAEIIDDALRALGVPDAEKSAVLMVGDREHDIFGAKARGLASMGVTFGYGSRMELETAGADYLADTALEIARQILEMNAFA